MIHKEVVKKWKERVSLLGLKQKDFADLLGIPLANWSSYVRGVNSPSLETYFKVENKLKKLEEFFQTLDEEKAE